MKRHLKVFTASLFIAVLGVTSCFKEEAPNAECDILEATLHLSPGEINKYLYNPSDTLVQVDYASHEIKFTVKPGTEIKMMAPTFKMTEGATIHPESGSLQDFSKGKVKYTVTSESGEWQREYMVGFSASTIIPQWEFEKFELEPKGKYYQWYSRMQDGGLVSNWASGNQGYTLGAPKNTTPEDYPSSFSKDGVNGYCLKLTTLSTGSMGATFKKPIAGGSLWLGEFDFSKSLTDSPKSINFGIAFDRKPLKLTGYYKFTPGPVVTDKNMDPQPGVVDEPDIFAVLFINHDQEGKPICLYSDNVKTSPQLVAIAQVTGLKACDTWQQFEADFNYLKPIDPVKLAQQGYSLSVMFNSSKKGDVFYGAIGSQLCIDCVEVICATNKKDK